MVLRLNIKDIIREDKGLRLFGERGDFMGDKKMLWFIYILKLS